MVSQDDSRSAGIDLHLHSTESDGLLSPSDLVALAAASGLRTIALTDHDSTSGVDEAQQAGRRLDIEVIAGIELSTSVDAGELHMLGYLIEPHQARLEAQLEAFRAARRRRAVEIVERLNGAGIALDLARVQELAGEGSIGRAHVARALVEAGHATSMDDAFARYLSRGRVGDVPRFRLLPVDAVRLIHAAGGVAVLAHPYSVDDLSAELPRLVAAGLDGLEVFYSLYNEERQSSLRELAQEYALVPTGGSDFHGKGEREGREIGSARVPLETLDRLREAAQRIH